MQLIPTLTSQKVQNRVREVGINLNYWYPVAWGKEIQPNQVKQVIVWQKEIAIYRDIQGKLHGLEDACPHKGVNLHKGEVANNNLVCPYHGWEFNQNGECVKIPYLPPEQKLPCAKTRFYPIQEKYNIIWVFPGDINLAENTPLPNIPEYENLDWLVVQIPAHFQAHFSICNENTMDVFHGFLHRGLQGWFNPVLLNLSQDHNSVNAQYRVSYQGWLTKFLGLSHKGDKVTTKTITIKYQYPHYHTTLEGVSSLYLMRLPVSPTETRSFSLLFLKIRLPKWLVKSLREQLAAIIWQFLFKKFLDQDVEMVESEQRNYLTNPQRHYVEINPAIIALQRLNISQYEKFVQQSLKSENIHSSLTNDPD